MEPDDINALPHLLPSAPPPLPGPGEDEQLTPGLEIGPRAHSTRVLSPTPRRAFPRPSAGLSPNFVVNSYYLSVLAHQVGYNRPLPLAVDTPVSFRPSFPRPLEIAAARVEVIEEDEPSSREEVQAATIEEPSMLEGERPTPTEQQMIHATSESSPSEEPPAEVSRTPSEEGLPPEEGAPSATGHSHTFIVTPPSPKSNSANRAMDVDSDMHPIIPPCVPSAEPEDEVNLPTPPPEANDLPTPPPEVNDLPPTDPPPIGLPADLPPVEHPPPSPEEEPATETTLPQPPAKRQAMRGTFRPPQEVNPEVEQWRTGKAPGHQGLTQKRRSEAMEEEEDKTHDIAESAERVLKRPFRPPRVVNAPTIRLKPRQADSAQTPRAPARRLGATLRASKAFRPPSAAVTSSPPSTRSGSAGKIKATDLNRSLIVTLEARVRTLKQAIKYNDPEEDNRISGLIHTWREAGREIADRLFALLPTPSEDRDSGLPSSRWDDWGYGDKHDTTPFNKDALEYLRNAPTDASGEVLDEAGNRIFGDEADLGSLIDSYTASADYVTESHDRVDDEPAPQKDSVWDKGAMLLRAGVDPDLLSWDRETEDWAEITDV